MRSGSVDQYHFAGMERRLEQVVGPVFIVKTKRGFFCDFIEQEERLFVGRRNSGGGGDRRRFPGSPFNIMQFLGGNNAVDGWHREFVDGMLFHTS